MRMLLKTLGDKQTKQGCHKPTRWEHKHAIKKYTGSINSLFLYESGFSTQSGLSSLSSAEQQARFLDLTANVLHKVYYNMCWRGWGRWCRCKEEDAKMEKGDTEPNIIQFTPWTADFSEEKSIPLNRIYGSQVELKTSVYYWCRAIGLIAKLYLYWSCCSWSCH